VLPVPYPLLNQRSLSILPPPDKAPIRAPRPSVTYPTPDPSILASLEASACRRLISRDYPPHELISLIEGIFTRKDEVKVIGSLSTDAARAFINVAHEVRPIVLHLCGTT